MDKKLNTTTSLTSKSRPLANHSLGLLKSGAMLRFLKVPYLSRYVAKGVTTMFRSFTVIFCSLVPMLVGAAEYDCTVQKKFNFENIYTQEYIKKFQFSVKVEENSNGSFLSRCSFSLSADKVTCDRYKVEKVVFDENVKIKKYYVFQNQFDVQLFSNLSFLENNGRGGIAYGKCKIVAP